MTEPQQPPSASAAHLTDEELSECAFSPQEAAARPLGHLRDCAECAGRLEDLRRVLTVLADLPEPEVPAQVGIRIDAAVARAWQEADEEPRRGRDGERAVGRRRPGPAWRRLALPLGALGVLAAGGVGLGLFLSEGGASQSAATAAGVDTGRVADAPLAQWVHSVLPSAGVNATQKPGVGPLVQSQPKISAHAPAQCTSVPQRSGFGVLASSREEFDGQPATLVVYGNEGEPASSTVYAVVYAGSCPTGAGAVLDQGSVSR